MGVLKFSAAQYLEPSEAFACSVMEPDEAAFVSIRYDEVETSLADLMAKQGVAIVTGVLDSAEITALEQALMQDMEELVDTEALSKADASVKAAWERVRSEGLSSWPAASLADVGARGRFQDHGMPQGRFAWNARTNHKVKHVYEILHGTKDLVSSCDNAFVANASQVEAVTNKNWPHVDQNDHDTRVPCKEWDVYQGLLYVWSSESAHSSTTVVWPTSHLEPYADYMSDPDIQVRIDQGKPHFTMIARMQPGDVRDRLIRGWQAGARRMPVPAGGLLLWSSRTTHQGWSGGPRLAQPLCWEPRSRCDEEMRERKLRLAALGVPSTHWASLAFPHELRDLCRPCAVEASAATERDAVRFPLHSTIRSQALSASADLDELWQRFTEPEPDWFTLLPADLKALLEESISADFKSIL